VKPTDNQQRTVLIADDDAATRLMIRAALQKMGLQTVEAADGEETLNVFMSAQPDLILMDIQMPKLSGIDACKQLRSRRGGEFVPIIMVTSSGDAESMKKAKVAGATDFLTKPIDFRLLGYRIRHALHRYGVPREV
jgi:DNA-binding response OmpR family regulator